MKPGERWLATLWPLVRTRLPAPPARVLDLGCGPLGGFVPFLHSNGYQATGVDPNVPDTPDYHRVEFEHLKLPQRVDAVIASTSLHHVADPAAVIDRLATTLGDEGTLVVVEWTWETFDEATAHWCFQRLGEDDENWLHRLRDEWTSSARNGNASSAVGQRATDCTAAEAAKAAGQTVRASPSRVWSVLLSRSCGRD